MADSRRVARWVMIGLLTIGFGVRAAGIKGNGYPYSFYPDEVNNVERAVQFYRPGEGFDFNPRWFNKPALGYYLNFAEYGAYYLAGRHVLARWSDPAEFAQAFMLERGPFYLIARVSNCLFALFAILCVYRIARRTFDRTAGVLAAAVLTFCPGHVAWSQVVKHDIPATAMLALALAFTLGAARSGRQRDSVLSGLFAGVGAAFKYYPFLLVVPIVLAHCIGPAWRNRGWRERIVPIGAAVGALIVGFFIGSPYNLLDPTWLDQNVAGALRHAQAMLGFGAGETNPDEDTVWILLRRAAWIFLGFRVGDGAFGVPGTLLLLVGIGSWWRQGRPYWGSLLLAYLVTHVFFLCVVNQEYPHKNHLVPMYPAASVFAGVGAASILAKWLKHAVGPGQAVILYAAGMVCLPIPGFPGYEVVRGLVEARKPRSEVVALRFVEETIAPGTTIVNDTEILPLLPDAGRLEWIVSRLEETLATARQRLASEPTKAERVHFQRIAQHARMLLIKYRLLEQAFEEHPTTRPRYDVIVLLKVWQTEIGDPKEVAAATFGYNPLWPRLPLEFPREFAHTVRCLQVSPSQLPPERRRATPVREGYPASYLVSSHKSYENYLAPNKRREWPAWARFYDDLRDHYDCFEVNGDGRLSGPVIRIWDLRIRRAGSGTEAPVKRVIDPETARPVR